MTWLIAFAVQHHYVGCRSRHTGLAIGVAAPNRYGAVAAHGGAVVVAGTDGDGVGQVGGNGEVAGHVAAPTDDGAIALEREAVFVAGSDRDDVAQTGGDIGLGV